MEISYIDRKTGQRCIEKVYGHKALSFLYGDGFFRSLILRLLAHIPFFSHLYGHLQKRPASAAKIKPFIKAYHVDETEFAETRFRSFNDFFIRKLKPEKRPIASDPTLLSMPADGRYLAYPQFNDFVIKGKNFSLPTFLCNTAFANRYSTGSMLIARLCPTDYHRFHFPCDGLPSKAQLINGPLYSVNPIALKKRLEILSENKRMITEIETERFGTMLYIEIGATSVGSIHQTYTPDQPIRKGQEKGYFEFGGSCLVLLFEKDAITFDRDLILNTQKGLETRANFGEPFAKCKAALH